MTIIKPPACKGCGFHYNCLCAHVPTLNTSVRIDLLMHETEVDKASNTGKLLRETFPHCHQHVWRRTEPPRDLLAVIADPEIKSWLLFPDENATDVKCLPEGHNDDRKAHFIMIDATWQQAKKMVRKSPWLQSLGTATFSSLPPSQYTLRRNQQPGNLCTCEAGIALLSAMGESENAELLSQYFLQFMTTFDADRQHMSLPAT
ncbi:DTW domain-containing protein [Veronia nyctiphanis]|uniref:tRNA-uridine aminocarboxypropyltransferase n=2 Tax=Veronia nyctiphanis TaxID=1278244 RepID=A0A4Q0YQZ7_9GAMM|nr:DTW domain-containing protein [Veronia nyctiphanis]